MNNVFQEYARSGVFERMYLVANAEIEKCIGDVPIIVIMIASIRPL